MRVKRIKLDNFMLFDSLDMEFSPNINIISGGNSTGKTAILKIIYSSLKSLRDCQNTQTELTKEIQESIFISKMLGVFRPDEKTIGRLVRRKQGSNRANILIELNTQAEINIGFGNRQEKHLDIDISIGQQDQTGRSEPVYLPPKEIISATENFGSLYSDYHVAIEEMYYDLARLLERPLRKGPNTNEQNTVLKAFEDIVEGTIIQKDKKFYLQVKGAGEFEMGLVSEGYRKLSTIMYLILSGSLGKNTVLFWDEPETNMNPKMIRPISEAVFELAKMGVQVIITTHDYFVQQSFNLAASYPSLNKNKLKIKFISLYKDDEGNLLYESAPTVSELSHNLIMEEFDALYDREHGALYEHN